MSTNADLTESQRATWMLFGTVMDLLPASLNSALLKSVGQPLLNIYVLRHLQQEPTRTARLSALAACLSSALPRMSRIVAKLEADGLVHRSACASDGRAVNVTLTEQGMEVARTALSVHDQLIRELVVETLSSEQFEQLREISSALLERLHPDPTSPMDRQRPVPR